jgi:hypothetical protein
MIVFQAEHNILMHPFHMLGVAGVKEYKLTYYTPEYETKDFTMTAILERRESESLWGRFCNWITSTENPS